MLRAGLIGLPSTGKTTLFQLLTSSSESDFQKAGRQNPNIAVAQVPDQRLDRLTDLFKPKKRTAATVNFVDMPARRDAGASGLVDVASYREADALLHVVRAFRDDSVPHSQSSVDPARDVRNIEDELVLADLAVAERRLERLEKERKKGASKEQDEEIAVLKTCATALEEGKPLRTLALTAAEAKQLRGFQFLSAKPLLLVLNVDESDVAVSIEDLVNGTELKDFVDGASVHMVTACAKIELEIAELEPEDAETFLADLGLDRPGLDRIIRAAYDLLGYLSFFTTGEDECRAWSIPSGTVAQIAAGEIHSDISRGFIRAEIISYDQLMKRGSAAECRKHGEMRLEGKDYVVQDGDVINFRFAV